MSQQAAKRAGMPLEQAVSVFTKTLISKMNHGQEVSPEELEALNSLREQAGLKPVELPRPEPAPEMQAIVVNGRKVNANLLPDNAVWTNRFDIKSESSDRLYRIAQNKKKRYWACSCPAWITRRSCKHLSAMGLPGNEEPFEAMLKAASAKTADGIVHSDDDLAMKMEPIVDTLGKPAVPGPEAGPSNDEMHANQHEENGVPVTDGGIKSPERANVNAIREAIETQAEMEVGKPIVRKQQEVINQTELRDEKALHPEGAAAEVSAAPGTQIVINVGSKKADWVDSHSVTCHYCGELADEREAVRIPAGFSGDPGEAHRECAEQRLCEDCDHPEYLHGDEYGCEYEPGDRPGGEGARGPEPAVARPPCGCMRGSEKVAAGGKQTTGVQAEPIGGEHQDGATSGMGTGAFGGTDLEGPSFKDDFQASWDYPGRKAALLGKTASYSREELKKAGREFLSRVRTAAIQVSQGEDEQGFHMNIGLGGREYVLRGEDAESFRREYAAIPKPEAKVNALVEKYMWKLQPYSPKPKAQEAPKSPKTFEDVHGKPDIPTYLRRKEREEAAPKKKWLGIPEWLRQKEREEARVGSYRVGFTFRGSEREAEFSTLAEADAFVRAASSKFAKVARDFAMRCPWCKDMVKKASLEESYVCKCGWDSHTSVKEVKTTPPKPKKAAGDPAKRNLVLEILKQGPKTSDEIERALGGGKYTNKAWPILSELAAEGLLSHKKMRWHLKTAEWFEWEKYADSPVEVVTAAAGREVFPSLAEAQRKYPALDPEHGTADFTWAMRGEINGKPGIRFEDGETYKMLSASAKTASQFAASDWKSANWFGHPGRVFGDPRVLIGFGGQVWGDSGMDDQKLLDGLAYENGVPLRDYDAWMRQHAGDTVAVAYRDASGAEKVLEHKLGDFPAVKSLLERKASSQKVAFGKRALTVETRVNESNKADLVKEIVGKLNAAFAEIKRRNPAGYMDSFEQQLPTKMSEIAAEIGLRMDYVPESDTYVFYDQAAAGTRGKKLEDFEQVASGKASAVRVTSVKAMPRKGTPEWHQLQIAIQTMKMPDPMVNVMGGPDRAESERILAQYGLRWDEEAYLAGGKGVKKAGDGMAKTDEQLEKEAGFNFFFPGQVIKEFYPELQHEIVDYPNATNTPMNLQNPEIVGETPQGDIEGLLDSALDTGVVEMIQLPADVGEVEPLAVAAADYSSTKPAGGMGIGRDGKPEVLEGAPLRKENDIRGYMFTDEFYGQYDGVPGAALQVASKTAAEGDEAKQFAMFLKKVCGEIAATLVYAFKVSSRPLLDKVPGVGEVALDQIEQGTQALPLGVVYSGGGRVKHLMDSLNDGDIKAAINEAWAQAAVWNDSPDGGFVYEVFVRPETIDTDSLKMKYKFVCGTRE